MQKRSYFTLPRDDRVAQSSNLTYAIGSPKIRDFGNHYLMTHLHYLFEPSFGDYAPASTIPFELGVDLTIFFLPDL